MSERPGVFLRFELGVSWNDRQPPKTHDFTYVSKGMRNRNPPFPRQLPPASTNYLTSAQAAQHHQSLNNYEALCYYSGKPQPQPLPQPASMQPSTAAAVPRVVENRDVRLRPRQKSPARGLLNPQQPQRREGERARSQLMPENRDRSRSSHERGKSAPPPFNDSPWDAEPEPIGASALPRRSAGPEVWKALPAAPTTQFQLGEGDFAWSPITLSAGVGDDNDVIPRESAGRQDTLWPESVSQRPSSAHDPVRGHVPTVSETTSMQQDTFRPTVGEVAENNRARDDLVTKPTRKDTVWPPASARSDREAPGRVTEIESLATALMTVDNGFEDQWWYQGPRLVNIAGDLISTTVLREYTAQGGTLGWAVADADPPTALSGNSTSMRTRRSPSSCIDIVSPLSDMPSPGGSFIGLRRSLTTRSDELHM